MALYFYQAFSKDGKRISGYIDAATTGGVREQLSQQGLFPTKIEIKVDQTAKLPWYKRLFVAKVTLKDILFFTKQLSILLKAGIPLVQALDLLTEQTEGALQNIVVFLRDNIKEGKSLADGLSQYPKVFDKIYIQLVRAGEATGKLEIILDRLNDYLVRRAEIKKRIASAMRYPMIQLGVIILVVVVLLKQVVPAIAINFSSMKANLPLPTQMLFSLSHFVTEYYLFLLIFLIIIVGSFIAWKSTKSGAYAWDSLKLKIPIVSYFTKRGTIVQFSRTLGMLLEGGVNLAEALDIVVNIVDNRVLAQTLEEAKENIIKQGKISQYLKDTGIFPVVAIYLINTGEQSGQLDTMLTSVAAYYEDELKEYTDTLSSLIAPFMLLFMALIVGFLVMAILLPMQAMNEQANSMLQTTGR